MKPFGILKISLFVAAAGAALVFSPACKAQEVSNDHFTDTGVQDVYGPPAKPVAPKQKQNTRPATTLQATAKRAPALAAQPVAQEVAEKRKTARKSPGKQ
jgi:hypothetical protein